MHPARSFILLFLLLSATFTGAAILPFSSDCGSILFQREDEARESAFSYLKPYGWLSEGGMVRRDPLATGANPDSVAAKLDFLLKNDSSGTAMIRWMPNVTYFDIGCSAVAQDAGLFPPGSSYQGMLVYPLMPAAQYITNLMIPVLHPFAGNIRIITEHNLQREADQYGDRFDGPAQSTTLSHTAATLTLMYEENGVTFKERWLALIEDPGEIGGGQWTNRETVYFRAPLAVFDSLEAIFEVIEYSIIPDPIWIAYELRQHLASEEVSLQTRNDNEQSGQRMLSDHLQAADDLHRAMFSNPRYLLQVVNPFNQALETASSAWRNMWINQWGDVLYSDDDSFDPNRETNIDSHEFQRCTLPHRETSMLTSQK